MCSTPKPISNTVRPINSCHYSSIQNVKTRLFNPRLIQGVLKISTFLHYVAKCFQESANDVKMLHVAMCTLASIKPPPHLPTQRLQQQISKRSAEVQSLGKYIRCRDLCHSSARSIMTAHDTVHIYIC